MPLFSVPWLLICGAGIGLASASFVGLIKSEHKHSAVLIGGFTTIMGIVMALFFA